MTGRTNTAPPRPVRLTVALLMGICLVGTLLLALNSSPAVVNADPIPPEQDGYPKFNTSVKTVTPTLANTGGATLRYVIEIRNTGSYTASDTTLTDVIPEGTTYDGNAWASIPSSFSFNSGVLTWVGEVGFDSTVVISFSVSVDTDFVGTVRNTAVISHPLISQAVTKTAEAVVTDEPILAIEKTSAPAKPGAGKPMTYTLTVVNQGQPAHDLDVTVTDEAPSHTEVRDVGPDGQINGDVVTWNRSVTLDPGDAAEFTFSVDVNDVPSGTVITNDEYRVASPQTGVTSGEPHTVTIVDPILRLTKDVWPDPPGSNRDMTYTLDVLNKGSLATDLVITDRVPAGVTYVSGGTEDSGVISWSVPRLDTGGSTELTYTVYISDVMDVPIVNSEYGVCCAEGVCQPGEVVTSVVQGPHFAASAELDPFVHQPGGGGSPVTPTLVVRNLGPGNALDAEALLSFDSIQISNSSDLEVIPDVGQLSEGPSCGENCTAYVWQGNLDVQEIVTFTTTYNPARGNRGRNTRGDHPYTTTVVITDTLTNGSTDPVSATADGFATHYADLVVKKSAPPVIGRGQPMTYAVQVRNNALSTEGNPWLTDTVPLSTSLVSISDGGVSRTLTNSVVISWTLPEMSPADEVRRLFTVRIADDLVSGTQIVNRDYHVYWRESETDTLLSDAGKPVTTTVKEVGLIDSYKEVTPSIASPGPGNVLTYTLHVVNSSPVTLSDVSLYDILPWEEGTYQRDAVASAGEVVSDIVSVRWTGDVGPFSSEAITFTTLVDEDYEGPVTNTATITHADLLKEVDVTAVAYVTDEPVLEITKRASRNTVERGQTLRYTIRVTNRGQEATELVITDTLPQDTEYVPGSGGKLIGGEELRWTASTLEPAESREFGFAVTVTEQSGVDVVNERYGVTCDEGVTALGEPVVTRITGGGRVYLPLVLKQQG